MADSTTPPADKAPEFEGEFDADRAKALAANLRAERDALKERLTAVTAERDSFKSAAEATGVDRDKALAEALKRAEEAERGLVIRDSGLPADLVKEFADYLTGTPAEVAAKAAKLAARLAPKTETPPADADPAPDAGADSDADADADVDAPPARPQPDLKPGHGGTPPAPLDVVALAREIRR